MHGPNSIGEAVLETEESQHCSKALDRWPGSRSPQKPHVAAGGSSWEAECNLGYVTWFAG